MTDDMAVDTSNAEELQQAVISVMTRHAAARPANTIKQYKSKQDDFSAWCTKKKVLDGSLVYESKLVTTMRFPVATSGRRLRMGPPQAGLYAYVKAVTDLYQFQKSIKMSQHPHPRGKALKGLMDTLKRSENKRKIETYTDRGLGTVLDGYNLEDMKALSTFWLKQTTGIAARSRVDFLIGHALLARGESRRFIQFPDMLSLSLPDEGPQVCTPLVVIMRKGKTAQVGRIEYGAAMRCKEILLCPLNALAMYLIWRWHVDLEAFLDFTDRKRWYDFRLLNGISPTRDIAYNAQLEGVNTAFTACGIDTSVWTHANRGSGAKLAELQGADENQIRRTGRWNGERMESCYLTTLPRKAMRALAGFLAKGGGYWIARAAITPDLALQKMVFPTLDLAETELCESGSGQIAASGFIGLLHNQRVVFLQDSVLLRKQFPQHRLWREPLFSTGHYAEFELKVAKSLSAEQPQDQRLEAAIPLVASTLSDGFKSFHSKKDSVAADLRHPKEQGLLATENKTCNSTRRRWTRIISCRRSAHTDSKRRTQ